MKVSNDEDKLDFVGFYECMEDIQNEEYQTLIAGLDEINKILDKLEKKNDIIQVELIELLETNRRTRQEFQKLNEMENSPQKEEEKKLPN